LNAAKELKTKPTQHSVKELLSTGIQADILVCRTEHPLPMDLRRKLALFCNVDVSSVIESIDAETIYDVPMMMLKERLDLVVINKLRLKDRKDPDLKAWKGFLRRLKRPSKTIKIGLVGKYNELPDAYKSIYESFIHAGSMNECKVQVVPIHSEKLEDNPANATSFLEGLNGVLVAPGFGKRGIEGKLQAIRYIREHNIPFFGICLGMQCCVVEFARHVLGLEGASSTEVDVHTQHPVIDLMPEQKLIHAKGGTMRLGAYQCQITENSKAHLAYKALTICERHRHRWELNNHYSPLLEQAGLNITGTNPETGLAEIVELKNHPWFVGVQFHPELKSTPERPHPLFVSFVKACLEY
jgi:CTP synthase